jgi:AraC-like DNA-binding protein
MSCDFTVMDRQLEAPRGAEPGGKLVLCQLKAGSSPIGAPAPSLKLVLDGDERYEIDGRSIVVRPGEFLYLDAGSQCIGTNRGDMTGICLILPHAPPAGGEGGTFGHDPVLGRALVLSTRASALGRTLDDYGRRIAGNPALGPALADELVARVAFAIAEPLAESRAAMAGLKAAKVSTRRELYRRLERARGFLHAHDDRNVTLTEMASVAGLSQFHLARYFKSAFGNSPIGYHRSLRLARAADLLAAGGRSVAQVAEATGYSDQVALSHAFRRHYGAPPQMWTTLKRAS